MKNRKAENVDRPKGDPFLAVAIVVAVVLLVLPLARAAFLPFVDLPQHVALAQLLNHIGDPGISRIYTADLLPQVNILALLIMASLFALMPEGAAVIVTMILYLVGLALALDRMTRALGTSRATVTVALLFAVNFNLMYGFMSFCLGVPILILVLARLAGPGARTLRHAFIVDAAIWMLLVLAHALLFVFGLAAALLWFGLAPRPLGRRVLRLAAAAPAVLWTLAWRASGGATLGAPGGQGVALEWHGFAEKLSGFGWSTIVAGVNGRPEWLTLISVGALIAALLLSELLTSKGKARRRDREPWRSRMKLWVRLVAILALALYFFLPYSVVSDRFVTRGVFLLYNRVAVLAPILLIPTLAWPRMEARRRLLLSGALLLHLMSAWHWTGLMARLGGEARGLDGAIAVMAPGKVLKELIYTPYSDVVDFPSYLHAGSYYQGRKLGEVDQSFALLPTTPVHYRDPLRPYLSPRDEHLAPHLFEWKDAALYDYILVYDRGGEWGRFYSSASFKRVYEQNGWVVFDIKARRR